MQKKISLVLGSGGARGYGHIGVIEELLVQGYEIKPIFPWVHLDFMNFTESMK